MEKNKNISATETSSHANYSKSADSVNLTFNLPSLPRFIESVIIKRKVIKSGLWTYTIITHINSNVTRACSYARFNSHQRVSV